MATLKDIAERVGVSITTVSRVLNGKGSISQETKDKVFQVMQELDYHPNEMARSLVNRNSHLIGLIVPYIDHAFFSTLTAGIEDACSQEGYKLFLCTSGGNRDREREQFAALQANNVAGVLVCSRDSRDGEEILAEKDIPLLYVQAPQKVSQSGDELPEGVSVTELLTTSANAFSKASGWSMTTYEREEGDADGPFALAVAATKEIDDEIQS